MLEGVNTLTIAVENRSGKQPAVASEPVIRQTEQYSPKPTPTPNPIHNVSESTQHLHGYLKRYILIYTTRAFAIYKEQQNIPF